MTQRSLFFLLLVWCGSACLATADDLERFAPRTLPSGPSRAPVTKEPERSASYDNEIFLKDLKGLVFISKATEIQMDGVSGTRGVNAKAVPFLDSPRFKVEMADYLGKPLSIRSMNLLLRNVVTYYAANDRPYVDVAVPQQDVTAGVLQVVVLEGHVGRVRVEGSKWFASQSYDRAVGLNPGDPLRWTQMKEHTDFINQNPFRSADIYLAPGAQPGTTDITIKAKERFPFRAYAGYDNNGIRSTDENELYTGFNYGNLFGLGHQFNYQFTTSPDFEQSVAHSGSYVAPLPWGHTVSLLGVYADTKPDVPEPFRNEGKAYQISGRYDVPLMPLLRYSHGVQMGYDFKSTNTNLDFSDVRVSKTDAEISQFVLNYHGQLVEDFGTANLNIDVFMSPGGMTSHNNSSDFNTITPNAQAGYAYSRITINQLTNLPGGFTLASDFAFQAATDTLLSTETIGGGGYGSVRGYAEREVSGDDGFIMTQELRSPEVHPIQFFKGQVSDSLQLLVFSDTGLINLQDAPPGTHSFYTLTSVGTGLRYVIDSYLTLRADYGWQLTRTGQNPYFDSRASVGVTISY